MKRVFPCISLWQPWASLLFVDDPDLRKIHETRGRPFPLSYFGEPIAIHAAKRPMTDGHISSELHRHCVRALGPLYRSVLPMGAVLGTVTCDRWVRTDVAKPESEADRIAGDWSRGRFAWWFADHRRFPSPIAMKGRQGWFRVELDSVDG